MERGLINVQDVTKIPTLPAVSKGRAVIIWELFRLHLAREHNELLFTWTFGDREGCWWWKKCKNVTSLWTLIFYKYQNVRGGADDFFLDVCFICALT